MAAEKTASFVLVFTSLWLLARCQDTSNVTVTRGQDATLHCKGPNDGAVMIIQWSRPDLKTQQYVFLYHSNKMHKFYQLSSYHDRVKLTDTKMENGDATIVLKNATDSDQGTYQCLISVDGTGRRRRNEPKLTSTINLQVTDSDHTAGGRGGGGEKDGGNMHGHTGLLVSAGVIACVGAVVVVVLGFRVRNRLMRKNSEQPADVEGGEQDTLENLNSKTDECLSDVTE